MGDDENQAKGRVPEPGERNDEPDTEALINQPGLSELREAVTNTLSQKLPRRRTLRAEGIAGLNGAIGSVPSGLASGVLAGVNPIYGLYACAAGPFVGGLLSSTQLMVVTTTSASALAAGQVISGVPFSGRENAFFLLVILAGIFQIIFGVLKFGRLARFVSFSVLTGFISGIAILTTLSQIPTVTRYDPEGGNRVTEAADTVANLGQVHPDTIGIAVTTAVLAIVLPRTKLGNVGSFAAIVIPSVALILLSLGDVEVVSDVGRIPGGIPLPHLPSLSAMSVDVVTGALAVSVITLVQGVGVSQNVPNPDGSRSNLSRDFISQGAANVASGFIRGIPVGSSLSSTALSVLSGARTRWAAIFAGLWTFVMVVLFPDLVGYVAMPALGALLVIASLGSLKPADMLSIWGAGWPSVVAAVTTFVSTLLLPIQMAVGIGVALSALLYVIRSSTEISLVELVQRPDGLIEERTPDKELKSDHVTVLDVYGDLFYAGARTLERLLPRPENAERPVVVFRLRGQANIGATLMDVLATYQDKLEEVDGRLYLTGVRDRVYDNLIDSGRLDLSGPVQVYGVTPIIWESTRAAVEDAQAWLVTSREEGRRDDESSVDG